MNAPHAPLRVGCWMVEPALHELSADGRTVKIEPKAMGVLCHLAGRPGQVVGREALLAAVWPGVIVGDDALTQVVVKLRRALGDSPEEPTYIQTVPKGGYRLVAPVSVVGAGNPAPGLVADERSPAAGHRARWIAVGASLVAVVALAWRLGHEGPAGGATHPSAPVEATLPTVAVVPFEPLGEDPREVLLARGITADLVTDLSKMRGLRVLSVPAEGAGTASAKARYQVSGNVQRAGDRVRLLVRLADPQVGALLWSERFDVAVGDLFEMQDALGPRILGQLPVKLDEEEKRRVAQRYTRNLEAYETYQRGQLALQSRRKEENELAREMFRRAIGLDATFARAYVGLAMTYAAEFRNQWVQDRASALDRALDLARTAHRMNPGIPESYWVLAFVHSHRHEHQQALRHLDEALRLNPSFADGYALKGGIHTSVGRAADAVELLHTAIRLAPEAGHTYYMLLGRAYLALGQLEQARINLEHALARNPEFIDVRVYLAATHVAAGDRAAATWELEEIRAQKPGFALRAWLESNPTADGEFKARLVRYLGELGL